MRTLSFDRQETGLTSDMQANHTRAHIKRLSLRGYYVHSNPKQHQANGAHVMPAKKREISSSRLTSHSAFSVQGGVGRGVEVVRYSFLLINFQSSSI